MKKRFKAFRSAKREVLDIDITSLLDILVILLVFLLKSYNATDLKLDLVPNLNLPVSQVTTLGNDAIIIQINNKRDIYLNNKLIGTTMYTKEIITELHDRLKVILKEREALEATQQSKAEPKKPKRSINIVMDKDLPYSELQKVMHTSATAGFPEFKLIVQGFNQ